jgi:hypothetical protein
MNLRRSLLLTAILSWLFFGNITTPTLALTAEIDTDDYNEIFPGSGRPVFGVIPLYQFVHQVKNNDQRSLVGVYVSGVMALPVVQQPAGQPSFVSSDPDSLTQFSMASEHGSTGILAHNTLSGALFSYLQPHQKITLVYGDGSLAEYSVDSVEKYQAFSPTSPFSDFMDLRTPGTLITSTELFERIYHTQTPQLVFQTCIAEGFEASWGRLFIIAHPIKSKPGQMSMGKYIQ